MSEALKPCPFCGCTVIGDNGCHVYCDDCNATSPETRAGESAKDAWNRRVSGWISVKERLPGKAGKYLVLFDFRESVCPSFEIECSLWNGKSWYHNYVSHWMALPGSPEVKE